MDRTYLQEAFQAMQLLEEEDFRLDDVGIKDILDFQDHDELNDIVDVVDPEAETEEEVKDSYVGNVVLVCEVCKSPIFKAPEDVVIEEGSDISLGARPLKRYIQQNIETIIAYKIIEDDIQQDAKLTVDVNDDGFVVYNHYNV